MKSCSIVRLATEWVDQKKISYHAHIRQLHSETYIYILHISYIHLVWARVRFVDTTEEQMKKATFTCSPHTYISIFWWIWKNGSILFVFLSYPLVENKIRRAVFGVSSTCLVSSPNMIIDQDACYIFYVLLFWHALIRPMDTCLS